jgi:hypothetical protein
MNWFEIIGYLGSVFIAASLTMKNIWKLRLLNMAGAVLFAVYGLIIHAYPVFLLNAFNASVNVFFLTQIKNSKDYFTLLALPEVKTLYLEKFLTFYHDDIAKLFPGFSWASLHQPHGFFVLRNLIPVGLFVYEPKSNGIIDIKLDYVIPDYRDFKNASFTYSEQKGLLKEKGFHTFITRSIIPIHQKYLHKIGFIVDTSDPTLFHKNI